ncbi:MAG: alkyl hydroperoxide reductase [Gammaproteobacteria bacterium]|nr:MAG: alkyl hydroperoxide reductase [Gammaproteobacteria bacterium]
MNIDQLINQLPDYAKDIKLNLSNVLTVEGAPDLSQKQIYIIAMASAYATKNTTLMEAIREEVGDQLAENEIHAAKGAAVIMAMNNIYYRFIHLVNDPSFTRMPAKLRMNIIGNPGISKTDFELICLAVSAINGCGMCIESHTHELVKANISKLAIQSAVRIAAVLNAVATGLSA